MRRIDHELVGLATLSRQAREDAIEHAHPAPADEVVVDRFVRAIPVRLSRADLAEEATSGGVSPLGPSMFGTLVAK